jgi:hypothetical protein
VDWEAAVPVPDLHTGAWSTGRSPSDLNRAAIRDLIAFILQFKDWIAFIFLLKDHIAFYISIQVLAGII